MLSVVISQKDDPVGTTITVVSLIQAMKEVEGEIIVVDNSLTPDSFAIPKEYIQEGLVKILRTYPPSIFPAREKGIEVAKGKYILILDSHMMMGYRAIERILNFMDKQDGSVGIGYGGCCYHSVAEFNMWVDRDLTTMKGIKLGTRQDKDFRIAFRGVPMIFHKSHYYRIGGYGCLAREYLPWGGGDYLLGIKTLLLGYPNWHIGEAVGIHLGPFESGPFKKSYMNDKRAIKDSYIGMLAAAYIVGGKKELTKRAHQIEKRIKGAKNILSNKALIDKTIRIARSDEEILRHNRKMTLQEVRRECKKLQQ